MENGTTCGMILRFDGNVVTIVNREEELEFSIQWRRKSKEYVCARVVFSSPIISLLIENAQYDLEEEYEQGMG